MEVHDPSPKARPTMEAMRAVKRRLSDVVCRQVAPDAKRLRTGPGGHVGDSAIQCGRPKPQGRHFGAVTS